ncbi:MAG TPA: hypothetical protein VHB97_19910 [Polyangia bacterium]|jgi:hypothetical protein|nr:hypothetical protein [Polyangia bacterium]
MRLPFLILSSCVLFGCNNNFPPQYYVDDLRVLAVTADPPEIAPGATSTLTVTWANPGGPAPTFVWDICGEPPSPTSGDINPACAANDMGAPLTPVAGAGPTVTVTMPSLTLAQLGLPDPSGGVYLPVRALMTAGSQSLTTFYRVRYFYDYMGNTPNLNPTLMGVFTVPEADAGASEQTTLGPDDSPVVHAGDQLHLRALLTADSAQTYFNPLHGTTPVTEIVTMTWYTTAGSFNHNVTGQATPDTTLTFDKRLPASGTPVLLWIIAQDERGGTNVMQRQLSFE